jgi:KipI family sensor histidine kinase inhibitor
MTINQVSTDTLLINFKNKISKGNLSQVQNLYQSLLSLNDPNIIEIIPSYSTILIKYNILLYTFETLKDVINSQTDLDKNLEIDNETITIDVYYGKEVGLDLETIANNTQLSIEEIIQIHSNKIYDVYAIGFLPGFGFLGEVDPRISTPRLKTPRKKVLKGSVAIADNQTAIYPSDSSGGWNIIGKTTYKLFNHNNPIDTLSPLTIGKKVKFNPISKKEFLNQGGTL